MTKVHVKPMKSVCKSKRHDLDHNFIVQEVDLHI